MNIGSTNQRGLACRLYPKRVNELAQAWRSPSSLRGAWHRREDSVIRQEDVHADALEENRLIRGLGGGYTSRCLDAKCRLRLENCDRSGRNRLGLLAVRGCDEAVGSKKRRPLTDVTDSRDAQTNEHATKSRAPICVVYYRVAISVGPIKRFRSGIWKLSMWLR